MIAAKSNFNATGGFSAADSVANNMQSLNASISDQAPITISDAYSDATSDTISDNNSSDASDSSS
jgi:hypothetical protein